MGRGRSKLQRALRRVAQELGELPDKAGQTPEVRRECMGLKRNLEMAAETRDAQRAKLLQRQARQLRRDLDSASEKDHIMGLSLEAWEAAFEAEFEGVQALEDGDEVKEGMMKGYTIHFEFPFGELG